MTELESRGQHKGFLSIVLTRIFTGMGIKRIIYLSF